MKSEKNLILVVAGGIGNQLFMYAAAKRLAEANGARLLLDIHSGFAGDSYQQTCQLDKFSLTSSEAPPELLLNNRWGKLQRSALKRLNRWLPYQKRGLILEETGSDKMASFDPRLLNLTLTHRNSYMIHYFQCEKYFSDIREGLLREFVVSSPLNTKTIEVAAQISSAENPIAVHARQLRGAPNVEKAKTPEGSVQKSFSYYDKAIDYMADKTPTPHFFCFGDNPKWLKENWNYDHPVTFVSHNNGQEEATQDFHLMGLCKHFIVGNSTFSWWPAWLSQARNKIVLAPANKKPDIWSGNKEIIPSGWVII